MSTKLTKTAKEYLDEMYSLSHTIEDIEAEMLPLSNKLEKTKRKYSNARSAFYTVAYKELNEKIK